MDVHLPAEHFLCIRATTDNGGGKTLGQTFLRHTAGAEELQLVILVVPELFTVEQMRRANR